EWGVAPPTWRLPGAGASTTATATGVRLRWNDGRLRGRRFRCRRRRFRHRDEDRVGGRGGRRRWRGRRLVGPPVDGIDEPARRVARPPPAPDPRPPHVLRP